MIHAHPFASVALSLVGIGLDEPLIPETVVMLGQVPTAPNSTPSSEENRDAIVGLIGDHNAVILAHHGTLTVGADLQEAYFRLETLEHAAHTVVLAYMQGEPHTLSPQAVEKLLQMVHAR